MNPFFHYRRPALPRPTALIAAFAMVSACHCLTATAADAETENRKPLTSFGGFTDRAASLAIGAMSLIGIHYQFGGNSPDQGLDCSGLVRYVFKEARGADLPRTTAEISKLGENIDQRDLQPGDLVFFNTLRQAFSHVGIYLGNNRFIHAPSEGGAVRIDNLDLSYWKNRFNGARRIGEGEQAAR